MMELVVPHHENEYAVLVKLLDYLIDVVGEDEDYPLASLMARMGDMTVRYEDEWVADL